MDETQILRGLASELEAADKPEAYAPRDQRLPAYVEHAEGIGQVGALVAEATIREYEKVVATITAMAGELQQVIDRCDDVKRECLITIKKAQEWAEEMRERGKETFQDLQRESLRLDRIGKEIEALRQASTGVAA